MALLFTNIRKRAQTFYTQNNYFLKMSTFIHFNILDIILETILAFCAFAFVASITPGPTNFLILSTSHQFGIKKSFALIFGAAIGAAFLVLITGFGIGDKINDYPIIKLLLSFLGGIWLSFISWKIFTYVPDLEKNIQQKNQKNGFLTGFSLQFINPKTWLMAIAVITVYTVNAKNYHEILFILSGLFMFISLPCLFMWAYLGQITQKVFSSTSQITIFYKVLGSILFFSVWYPILKPLSI